MKRRSTRSLRQPSLIVLMAILAGVAGLAIFSLTLPMGSSALVRTALVAPGDTVASYTFDEGSGTSARDGSGNAHHAALSATSYVPGRQGTALAFNGTTSVANSGSATTLDGLKAFTVSGWIFPRNLGENNNGRIIGKAGGSTLPSGGWSLALAKSNGNGLRFAVDHARSHLELATKGNVITFNTWQHVAVTWDGSTNAANVHIYVNGIEVAYNEKTNGSGARSSDASQSLLVGNNPGKTRTFNGSMDDLSLFRRALSSQEIAGLMTGTTPTPPPTSTFDFTLTARSAVSLVAGGFATSSITATAIPGSTGAHSAAFTVSGVPAGMSYSLAPASCSMPCATYLTLTAATTTAAGTYPIVIQAVASGMTHVVTIQATVNTVGSAKFSIGDRTSTTAVAIVRSSPSSVSLANGTQGPNAQGRIAGGPVLVENIFWWNVDFDLGADGWVGENLLARIVADTAPPTAPPNLTAMVRSSSRVDLSWSAASDNTAVVGYRLFRNGSQISQTAQTTYSDTATLPGTAYVYTVSAYDAAGNVSALSASAAVQTPAATSSSGIWKPAMNTSWQWQLTGTVNADTPLNVAMYDIDLFDNTAATIAKLKAKGIKVICYFSAGSYEDFRSDASAFPAAVKGRTNGWAGEQWLDVRRLDLLGPIMEARLQMAKDKGCDGVEPDNVDGHTNNTGFPLTFQDMITFNTFIANAAHARGLSVGIKNDLDQLNQLLPLFDWALNEQCFEYDECDAYNSFIAAGKAVFNVEYTSNLNFCASANARNFNSLKKNLDLDASREACR